MATEKLIDRHVTPTGTPDTTLDGAINNSTTTVVVASLPAGVTAANFRFRIDDEIFLCTAIGGTGNKTWTVSARPVDAAFAAAAHSNGANVYLMPTAAGMLQWLKDQVGVVPFISHQYLGYNTIGGSNENVTNFRVYMKKVTVPTGGGLITSIACYLNQTTDNVMGFNVAVMADVAGTPGSILAYNGQAAVGGTSSPGFVLENSATPTYVDGWIHMPIGFYATAGDYWICVQFSKPAGTLNIKYDATGSDHFYTSTGFFISHHGRFSETTSANQYSIRASLIQ